MLSIDAARMAEDITRFIRDSFAQAGFSRAVIALSGGIDSATSCALAVKALGAPEVYPLLLPYGALNAQGAVDAMHVVQAVGIPPENVAQIDIQPLADPFFTLDPAIDALRKGNIMARVRMIVIFDRARDRHALVVGTENKSEHLLGYYTRFGDEASDIEPLRNLYKTQVFQLAEYLGLPEAILRRAPTAGLWEGQTDEGEFGFTYAEADPILHQLFDLHKSPDEVAAAGWKSEAIRRVSAWVGKNNFKHRLPMVVPPGA
jgi:NAD+ synthase